MSRRLELVTRWRQDALPDFVSLNVSEPGFGEMAHVLGGMGVGVEAGVWSVADAHLLLNSSAATSCVRVLVEVIGMPRQRALDEADRIFSVLHGAGLAVPVLLHGDGDSTWPVLDRALACGLESRVGLEDVLTDAAGARVQGNAHLMRLALGRRVVVSGDGAVVSGDGAAVPGGGRGAGDGGEGAGGGSHE